MSDTMKSTGKTVDEAVREALLRMGLRREEVSVTVLQESRVGFLGMGRRDAVVEVAKKSDRDSSRRRGGGRSGRGRSTDQAEGGGDGRRGRSQRAEASDRRRSRRQDDGDGGDRRRGRRKDQDGDGGENRRDARQGDDDRNAAAAKDGEESGTRKRRRRRRPRRRKSGAEVDQSVNAQSNDQQTDDQQTSGDQGRGDQSRGGRDRNDRDRSDRSPRSDAPAAAKPDDGGRGEQRSASRTPEDREPTSNEPADAKTNEPRQETRQESRPDRQRDEAAQDGGRDDRSAAATVATDVVAINRVQPFGAADAGDPVALLERAATSLMVKSGFQTRVSVQEGDYHKVKMVVDDRSAGVLIGRQGSTVDAVEHLVERIATRTVGERVKLNLDINNYRLRREDGLLGRTRRAINEARETGEPVHLDPAGGRERRIVHLEVVDDEDLVTYTEMDEDGKHVVICRPDQVPDEYRDPDVHGPAPERTEETAAAPESDDESGHDDESGGEIEVDVKLVATSPAESAPVTESAPVDEPEPGNEKPADEAPAEDERRADA